MSQKVTDNDRPAGLPPKQIAALESLLSGATATAAAKAAGVNRRTLWRWVRADVGFRAALNTGRMEAREAAEIRVDTLAESAISLIKQAIDDGDVRTALAVLRGRRLLDGQPAGIGPDNPSAVAKADQRKEKQVAMEEWRADLGFF